MEIIWQKSLVYQANSLIIANQYKSLDSCCKVIAFKDPAIKHAVDSDQRHLGQQLKSNATRNIISQERAQ